MNEQIKAIFHLLHLAEKLKTELRHCWFLDGRRESVADHVWRTSFMAMLFAPYLTVSIDLEKTLKMIIVHDLVEIFAGDVPAFEVESMEAKQKKQQAEAESMERMQSQLPSPLKEEIPALWHEFEQRQTPEALFAHTLDKLEAQLQHNEADISTWLPIEKERVFYKFEDLGEIDPFLSSCVLFVKEEALQKMQKAGCNLIELQQLSMRSP